MSEEKEAVKFYVPLALAFVLLLVLNIFWGQNRRDGFFPPPR